MKLLASTLFLLLVSAQPVAYTSEQSFQDIQEIIKGHELSEKALKQWQGHVLYPHIYGMWLEKNIETVSTKKVESFLDGKQNAAAAWLFLPAWQQELIRREDWQHIEQSFENSSDAALSCYYLAARQQLNKSIPAEKIETLWDTGNSQPEQCDPFFIAWLDEQADKEEKVWHRQILAFYQRNGSLLRYLDQYYTSENYQALSQFLIEVYNEPKNILNKNYDPNSRQKRELALAAVNRMAYQDPRSASNLWLQIVKATPNIGSAEVQEASEYLGIAMAKLALPEADYWLTIADPEKSDETMQHWRLQIALSDKDYQRVEQLYDQLHPSLKTSSQWQYWYGFARYKNSGALQPDNPLIELSKKRLYYGYLAAGVLGTQPTLEVSNNYSEVDIASLNKIPSLKRAKALYLSGETLRAQVEWNLWVRNQNDQTQHAAGELALSWGWYAKASQSAGWSGRYDLIHLRYPDAFGPIVEFNADSLQLPQYWVYGVMRQESRFDSMAVSPAGALGLMQIMPATAKATSQKFSLTYSGTEDLFDPYTNIVIGTHYLRELLDEFQHPVYATAAYNAGPSRVEAWQDRFPHEMVIWIESIPFDETRNYVKSVLAYSQIYALTRNTGWNLTAWTAPNELIAANQ
ncbi:lytic transglycosylase domain-containing protein [Reinekea marinisedimentorum]|uniref:Soluble lytic murein transglycosylase n=1 Tax=Reinekea marinisedimentorum TaxID=230495 RepID=A0A4R3ICU5_9GAMM|nr:lytic transglycosylase domain-containing protein [Reinekea marinisedimentorum]TCS42445.1 soluble lytic murein transglycosylase [Reinekea marinisedimentorum]